MTIRKKRDLEEWMPLTTLILSVKDDFVPGGNVPDPTVLYPYTAIACKPLANFFKKMPNSGYFIQYSNPVTFHRWGGRRGAGPGFGCAGRALF